MSIDLYQRVREAVRIGVDCGEADVVVRPDSPYGRYLRARLAEMPEDGVIVTRVEWERVTKTGPRRCSSYSCSALATHKCWQTRLHGRTWLYHRCEKHIPGNASRVEAILGTEPSEKEGS